MQNKYYSIKAICKSLLKQGFKFYSDEDKSKFLLPSEDIYSINMELTNPDMLVEVRHNSINDIHPVKFWEQYKNHIHGFK